MLMEPFNPPLTSGNPAAITALLGLTWARPINILIRLPHPWLVKTSASLSPPPMLQAAPPASPQRPSASPLTLTHQFLRQGAPRLRLMKTVVQVKSFIPQKQQTTPQLATALKRIITTTQHPSPLMLQQVRFHSTPILITRHNRPTPLLSSLLM